MTKRAFTFLLALIMLVSAVPAGVCATELDTQETIPQQSVVALYAENSDASGKPRLFWEAVSGAACYEVYRSGSKDGTYSKTFTTTGTSYTNSKAVAGLTYYYKVKALGEQGNLIAESEPVFRRCNLPRPVVKMSNEPATGKVQLSWQAVDGAIGYCVSRSEAQNGPFEPLCAITETEYTDQSSENGITYYYKVQAISENINANSSHSKTKMRTCDFVPPVIEIGYNSKGKPRISWEPVQGAKTYRVYRSESENGTYKLMYKTSGTSYSNTKAEAGVTYYYKVKAVGEVSSSASAYSNTVSGSVARGIVEIDGKTRYFAANGQELVVVNPWNYVPKGYKVDLVSIGSGHKIAEEALEDYQAMIAACKKAGHRPMVVSSYRTHEYQKALHERRIQRFMNQGYSRKKAEQLAAKVVAVAGTSEHQLGLALDIVDSRNQSLNESQAKTATQKWLMKNSWRYGWILRYPEGSSESTGIIYEPWHYRYVGREAAADIHASGLCLEDYLQALTAED